MTTVVSRLYESTDAAERVAAQLRSEGFPDNTIDIITDADARLIGRARVSEQATKAYVSAMGNGRALFVCRAPFTPFGAARVAMMAANSEPAINVGLRSEDVYIREVADLPNHSPSVLTSHPLLMTPDTYVGSGISNWTLSWVFGFPLLSSKRRSKSVMSGNRYMSRMFWPGKLISKKQRRNKVLTGNRYMFGRPKVSRAPRKLHVLHNSPLISARFGMRMLSSDR